MRKLEGGPTDEERNQEVTGGPRNDHGLAESPERRRGLGPWSRALALSLVLGAGGMAAAKEGSGEHAETVATTHIFSGNKDRSGQEGKRPVIFADKKFERQELDDMVLGGMQDERVLGFLAAHCQDAEQCFYYYGNQLEKKLDTEKYQELDAAVGALTGRSADERRFIGAALRAGFVKQPPSFGGDFVGMVESGEDMPPMKKSDRKNFYYAAYGQALSDATHFYEAANIAKTPMRERQALAELMGRMQEARLNLAARTARNAFRAEQGDSFEEWFAEGVPGHESGNKKWELAFSQYLQAIDALYAGVRELRPNEEERLEALHASARVQAMRAYHEARRELFSHLAHQAKGQWFGGRQAKRWADRAQEEVDILAGLLRSDNRLASVTNTLPSGE